MRIFKKEIKNIQIQAWGSFEGVRFLNKKREDVKNMLRQFYRTNKKIKGNIFHALQNVKHEYLP